MTFNLQKKAAKMKQIVIFGGTGMTGKCVVKSALEKGFKVRVFIRDEKTVPEEFKDKVELVKGDVLEYDTVEPAVQGMDAVVIVLGTRNDVKPTTMMSEGTKNIIEAMKKHNLKKVLSCYSIMSINFFINIVINFSSPLA